MPDGWYTVEGVPEGGWTTLRLRARADRAGRPVRELAVLRGPDNEMDYAPVGVVAPDGAVTWLRADRLALRARDAARVLAGVADPGDLRHAYAMRSGRCACCGRRLTVPESVRRGIGPECYRAMGGVGPQNTGAQP